MLLKNEQYKTSNEDKSSAQIYLEVYRTRAFQVYRSSFASMQAPQNCLDLTFVYTLFDRKAYSLT